MEDNDHNAKNSKENEAGVRGLKDPVCGMTVAPGRSAGSNIYEGNAYYFCSEHCLHKFKGHPKQYLNKKTSPSPETGTSANYTCPMYPEIQKPGPGMP